MSPAAQTQLRVIQVQEQIRSMAVTCQADKAGCARDFHYDPVKQCNSIQKCFIFIVILIDREVIEYSLSKLLEGLQINHQEVRFTSDLLRITFLFTERITCLSFFHFSRQFVDLCILLGCDYCEKICGLGPKRALKLIQKHRTIENVILHVNRKVGLVCSVFQKQI